MPTAEIKKKLHSYIDMIEDEVKLEMLNEAAEAYATNQPDVIDLLTPVQLNRLERSLKQADEGNTVSNEEVMKMSREWVKVHTK